MALDKDVPIAAYMTRNIHSVRHDADLATARSLMLDHKVRHLPVLEAGKLVGVLSERDLHLARAILGGKSAATPVEDVCAPVVYAVSSETLISEVAAEMAKERYGSAVIVDDNERVLGIFTTTDACLALSAAFEP